MSSNSDGSDTDERPPVSWLYSLPEHPIFKDAQTRNPPNFIEPAALRSIPAIPKTPRRGSDTASELSEGDGQLTWPLEQELPNVRQRAMCAIRDSELVVATGRELRILDLAQVKSRNEDGYGEAVNYKTLYTPAIDFDIQRIVSSAQNPKLLAVVGLCQLAIVVVPRREWANLISNRVECRVALIGAFFHGPASSPIVSAVFHPQSAKGAALCVLTRDGIMREYDINVDVDTPVTTIDFTKQNLAADGESPGLSRFASTSVFFGLDHSQSLRKKRSAPSPNASVVSGTDLLDEKEAVALCFGNGQSSWSAMTVYCLMKSGAIYAVSPYLPQSAVLPISYLHTLREYTDLLKTRDSKEVVNAEDTLGTPTKAFTTDAKVALRRSNQLKFINALLDQAKQQRSTSNSESSNDAQISINTKAAMHGLPRLRRQGPILLQPAPAELDGEAESNATDLLYLAPKTKSDSVGVVLIAYSDGKIDECVDYQPIEARWEVQNETDLPSLLVAESVDLGLVDQLEQLGEGVDVFEAMANNAVSLSADPIYSDSVFIHHSFGVHSISISSWLEPLSTALAKNDASALQKVLSAGKQSALKTELITFSTSKGLSTPVSAVTVISDVYLGYAVLMLTDSMQLVARERGVTVANEKSDTVMTIIAKPSGMDVDSDTPAYVSLLSKPPFEAGPPLNQPLHALGGPRFALPPDTAGRHFDVTPASLRFLGQTVTSLRTSVRDLVQTGNSVQSRLQTQCRELARQLERITNLRANIKECESEPQAILQRVEKAETTQKALLDRTDRLLQRLMDAHEPVLSSYEKEWLNELDAKKALVTTASGRCDRLRGQVHTLEAKSSELQSKKSGELDKMGKSQLARFQIMLQIESSVVDEARRKVESLQARLNAEKTSTPLGDS